LVKCTPWFQTSYWEKQTICQQFALWIGFHAPNRAVSTALFK
jgi:hypothetical protein